MSVNSNVRNFCSSKYLVSETFCSIETSQLNVSTVVVLIRKRLSIDDYAKGGGEELFTIDFFNRIPLES